MKAYQELESHFKKMNDIGGALSVLHWDFAVMMPKGGAGARAEQMATLSAIHHELLTDERLPDLIARAKSDVKELNGWQKSNLRLMEKSWIHANAVDKELVIALSRAGSECEMVWRKAKAANDFKTFAPYQKKVLGLVRKIAQVKADKLGTSLYDALLDQYDDDRKSKEIDKVFADLKTFLPKFAAQVAAKQKKEKIIPMKGVFPIAKQRELGEKMIRSIGFDFNHGRLDISAHPFCGGIAEDVRITTRYDEKDFTSSLMGVLHETGHAMYERGLPKKWFSQPVGGALGMTIHESQSLLMEMQVCRSDEFFQFALPHIKKTFKVSGKAWELENMRKIYRKVEPSFIRVDADEVTYPLHVILRYELEKELIAGNMEVSDLPSEWNKKMKEYLGITPKTDREGCMQDIHWTDGAFGYFPTYTLGAMHAAQFFNTAKRDNPAILKGVKKGDFKPLIKWLGDNIHSQGSKITANQLIKQVTKQPLNAEIFKNHLRTRYLA